MAITVVWTTPRLVDWGKDYEVAFNLESDTALDQCKVRAFEDGFAIPPSPHFVGSVVAHIPQPVVLRHSRKDWKFYVPHIGWPCRQTEKVFNYYVQGEAKRFPREWLTFRGPVGGSHHVKVRVPQEKLKEAQAVFGSFLLSIASGALTFFLPPLGGAVLATAASSHLAVGTVCYEKMKDPPEHDENYKRLDEPQARDYRSLGLSEVDAETPLGKLIVHLSQLHSSLKSFYKTEDRLYTAREQKDIEVESLQMKHLKELEQVALSGLNEVIEAEIQTAAFVPGNATIPTEKLFEFADEWLTKQHPEEKEVPSVTRDRVHEAIAEVLKESVTNGNGGFSYHGMVVKALDNLRELKRALELRTAKAKQPKVSNLGNRRTRMVQFFLDSASLKEIEEFTRWGIVDGVTTNQKKFLSEGGVDFKRHVLRICALVNGPVSVETTKNKVSELLTEAREYASWHKNVVVKVAMYGDGRGLEVVHRLAKEHIRTNMTAMMTFNQLILAAKAGATYVSLVYSRSKEAGENPVQIIRDYVAVARESNLSARLIIGSIRTPEDVALAVAAGAHIMTVPAKILKQMPVNKRTEETIEEFDKAWQEFLAMRREEITK